MSLSTLVFASPREEIGGVFFFFFNPNKKLFLCTFSCVFFYSLHIVSLLFIYSIFFKCDIYIKFLIFCCDQMLYRVANVFLWLEIFFSNFFFSSTFNVCTKISYFFFFFHSSTCIFAVTAELKINFSKKKVKNILEMIKNNITHRKKRANANARIVLNDKKKLVGGPRNVREMAVGRQIRIRCLSKYVPFLLFSTFLLLLLLRLLFFLCSFVKVLYISAPCNRVSEFTHCLSILILLIFFLSLFFNLISFYFSIPTTYQ